MYRTGCRAACCAMTLSRCCASSHEGMLSSTTDIRVALARADSAIRSGSLEAVGGGAICARGPRHVRESLARRQAAV